MLVSHLSPDGWLLGIYAELNPMNTFHIFVETHQRRFTMSAHTIPVPPGGLTGLMERPQRLDWFAIRLTYADHSARLHTAEVVMYQSKLRHGLAPDLYYVLLLLMADLMCYMQYTTFEAYWAAVPCYNRRQAEVAFAVTVQRGLLLADLLGVDLQEFANAYGDDATVVAPVETPLMIVERV